MEEPLTEVEEAEKITEFFGWMPWEWFVSVDLPNHSNLKDVEWYLRKWRRAVFNAGKGHVAYQGVFIHGKSKHAHLLMLSKPNKHGETLSSLTAENITDLKDRWYQLTGRTADIRPVSSPEGVAAYLACKKNIGGNAWELINPCGVKTISSLKAV